MRIIQLVLLSLLLLPIWSTAQSGKKVVATASIFADMTRVIAGGLLEVETIVPIGGDPHLHEPTPRDARLVSNADLILRNGLTFEGWLNELIENSGTTASVVTITDGIEPIRSQQYQNSTDPHAWMDASLGTTYLKNIRDALVTLDPDNADVYNFNYEAYRQQLADLDREIQSAIARIPEAQRVLITSHDAFQYYGRRYGLRLESVLGTSTDADVQTADVLRINKLIRTQGIPAVFIESTINPKLLQQLASDNNIKVGGQLYADSLGDADSPASTYLDMLRHNTQTIVAALTKTSENTPEPSGKTGSSSGDFLLYLFGILAVFVVVGGLIWWMIRRAS